MKIEKRVVGEVTVVQIVGELDGNTAPVAQEEIVALAAPGCKVVLDMSQVPYMSSAGLRLLLLAYRTISGNAGSVVLVGLSDDLADTMKLTGFLDFFKHFDALDAGIASLA